MGQGLQQTTILGAEGTIQEVARAGLRDRDYENLPTGDRLRAHGEVVGDGKRIVCDCVDKEPGLEIDRFLLASQAEAIVEGAFIAALATSTPNRVFHVAEDDQTGAEAVAVEVERAGVAGASSLGGFSAAGVKVDVIRAPFKQNLKGYEDVPTLVINGETLMNISRVLRDGADAYRRSGSPKSPGMKLFQISGSLNKTGIYELPLGTTVRQLVLEVCGGVREGETLQAVIVGGSKGACYKEDELDLLLDFDSVRQSGGVIGSGGIAVLSDGDCIIDQTKQRISSSCFDDCGKCSLGREGSYQLREIMADMTKGKSRGSDLEMLREIGEAMRIGCACASGRTAPNIILSTMEKFPEEYEAHMKRKKCGALVCEKYVTFHILPDLCDGCGACVDECPEDAIEGAEGKIHVIDQDSCEKCGKCHEVCSDLQKAVVKAGPVKPQTPKRPIPVGSWKG
jgi:NADH-quinone oxidoreductase subunit F